MKFYTLPDGDVAGFDDPSQAPNGSVEITAEEFAEAATTPSRTLSDWQTYQKTAIDAAYAAAVTANLSFKTAGGVTAMFEADVDSQTLVMQATQGYAIAGATPSGFYWLSADNTQVPFTLADLQGLYQAILSQGWTAFQKRTTLKQQIDEATTISAVQAIVWSNPQ